MTGTRSVAAARRAGARLRRRLASRSDAKRAGRARRSQNRALMRGGRA
ncbi:MAG: hypothetical protein ACK5V2_20310 [Pseudomonadota bacterium]|jgi:plasmid stabilization system protein ParE